MRNDDSRSSSRAAEKVAREIKRRIANGTYSPDSYLPAERELAQSLGTSRTTLRAALASVISEGLLVQGQQGFRRRVLPPQKRPSRTLVVVCYRLPTLPGKSSSQITFTLNGIQERLSTLGYEHELLHLSGKHPSPAEIQERYAGIIYIHAIGSVKDILEIEKRRIPLVIANLERDLDVSATWVDHRKTSRHAVSFLTALGHRRIAFLTCNPKDLFYGKAMEGYLAGLKEVGITPDETLVQVVGSPDPLSGYVAARELLDVAPLPTAIVAGRDYMAQGACRVIEEKGLAVGRDISVIGFDDNSWPLEEPFLTTFREPCYELGAVAAEMLVDRLVNGWRPPQKREVEAPFIVRRTAGPPAKGTENTLDEASEMVLRVADD